MRVASVRVACAYITSFCAFMDRDPWGHPLGESEAVRKAAMSALREKWQSTSTNERDTAASTEPDRHRTLDSPVVLSGERATAGVELLRAKGLVSCCRLGAGEGGESAWINNVLTCVVSRCQDVL